MARCLKDIGAERIAVIDGFCIGVSNFVASETLPSRRGITCNKKGRFCDGALHTSSVEFAFGYLVFGEADTSLEEMNTVAAWPLGN